jgi:extracellular factor (EF) 3-hydroxypalmitic acid methyl ester biosynthesis protein
MTRRSVAFELYNPYSIVQLSEVLADFRVVREGQPLYQGRAVVNSLVPTGALTIVSVALVDSWSELQGATGVDAIQRATERFIQGWEHSYNVRPSYQLAVGALASFLLELSRFLGQAQAVYVKEAAEPPDLPEDVLDGNVRPPVEAKLAELFAAFEGEARKVPESEVPIHKAFAQRELHPLLLCDPFLHRSFTKPLGYAGDYQMVNMILGKTEASLNAYARVISGFNLRSAPAAAHRNRIRILRNVLRREARRRAGEGHRLRVLNIGCGPAGELVRFLEQDDVSDTCDLTLVDFNEETLAHAERSLRTAIEKGGRRAALRMVHQSIHELLEAAATGKTGTMGEYDLVYCAGLFDYLSDRVCRKLTHLYCRWTAPGGVVVATNVHARNPIRCYMEHIAEWYLVHRDEQQLERFAPEGAASRVFSDPTGVNIFLEVHRPGEKRAGFGE